ncbi:hypothetical protein Back11_31360 [Paenibacillus baekrokdamisoli]|uniref:Uncharacterized protein n=1 Tax=Paenibacillus baekrokdamisoli TaxID=1712516 RepID=A0A3G9J7M1_9BACL|nr:uroporphyrinogen-III synthase [Paenibacillus baekrokdamisoli]MBB3071700.1 uroporphyrinogen-III synthase [Paenibacillus baekrokdamisoli]BBH21791.1 hypothetical protein Back11_31360 [Paenibacillus baekrokdamisoli]
MSNTLNGKRIVIAGSQKINEMQAIIGKQGGIAVSRPLQGISVFDERELEQGLTRFAREGADWILFTTGLGAEALYQAADKLNILPAFTAAVAKAKIASRGYKTYAFLKKHDLQPIVSDDDGTVNDLLVKLAQHDFAGQRVMIQLHGELSPPIQNFMESNGTKEIQILLPYRHHAPERYTLQTIVHELTNGLVDAVCFTTRIQVQYLFEYAREMGVESDIRLAFNGGVIAGAVGKVTSGALREEGINRVVMPELERMGAMIVELSRYYSACEQNLDQAEV